MKLVNLCSQALGSQKLEGGGSSTGGAGHGKGGAANDE